MLFCGKPLIRKLKFCPLTESGNKKLVYCIISGILLGLAYPPVNFYFLIFAGLTILLQILSQCKNIKQIIYCSYLVFFIFELWALSWVSLSGFREQADRFLIAGGFALILIHPLFFLIPIVPYYIIQKKIFLTKFRFLLTFLFPLFWVSFEYLHSQTEVSFPWFLLGNAFTTCLNKIQYIEYTGVYGISFWTCLISYLLYLLFNEIKESRLKNDGKWLLKRKNILLGVLIILVYIFPDLYFVIFMKNNITTRVNNSEKINAGVIQPNINPWHKWGAHQTDLVNIYKDMIKKIYSETGVKPDIIILPETAIPFYFLEHYYSEKYNIIKNIVDSINIPVLIGYVDLFYYNDSINAPIDAKIFKGSGKKHDIFNSAVLIEKNNFVSQLQKYSKIKLVIGSERMPYQERLPFLKNLISWGVGLSSYQIGRDTTIFNLNSIHKFNTVICYESIYPDFFARFVNKGAEFSVIITNDGWWGKLWGTYQHNQFAALRAIENRRWIVRCANTGISCTIDPLGNIHNQTNINEEAIFKSPVGIIKEKSFYTIYGDVFSVYCLYISIIFIFSYFVIRIILRYKKNN